ncbi:MAG: alpha-E domain-containing protein [Pseudomonadales bacterium]|nr:alpha-E domain-containing protein [Pseudomonadales bacterium]
MLLSRVAERVYWQARYLERVENTARLLNVFSTLLMDLPKGTKLGWHSLVEITGTDKAFAERYKQESERNVMRFLLAERNGYSILDNLAMTRENARTTREIMPTEAFEMINDLYYLAREKADAAVARGPRHEFLDQVISDCQQITGLLGGCMSRDEAYSFIRLGRSLERADMTTRIVDVGTGSLLESLPNVPGEPQNQAPFEGILWMNILRSLSAYQMYRQHVRERISGEDVVNFLLKDEQFPRATAHNLTTMNKVLKKLPRSSKVKWQVDRTRRLLGDGDIEKLLNKGLLKYIDELQKSLAATHAKIANTWFLH